MTVTRADVVRLARSYVGTPFQHMGRQPGVGLDCAGLVICVARELGLVTPDFDVPAYTPSPDGSLLAWCDRYMVRLEDHSGQPGDVLAVAVDSDPQHLCVLGDYRLGGLSIIHALSRRGHRDAVGRVVETRLMYSRTLRHVATYALPGVE